MVLDKQGPIAFARDIWNQSQCSCDNHIEQPNEWSYLYYMLLHIDPDVYLVYTHNYWSFDSHFIMKQSHRKQHKPLTEIL